MSWFWLSFASPLLPPEDSFLGVAVVEAESPRDAVARAWDLGCNPGGEFEIYLLADEHVPAEQFRNRLLGRRDMRAAGGVSALGLDLQ